MARNRETKIELTAYDDLFQTDESRAEAALSKIRDIPLSEIDEFPDHPFKVLMDEDMVMDMDVKERNKGLAKKRKLLSESEKRITELDMIFKRLYEDNISGKLTDERFHKLSTDYEAEQAGLQAQAVMLREEIEAVEGKSANVDRFLSVVRQYTDIPELTPRILHEFIEKIIIHAATDPHSKINRRQEVDIYYKGIGILEMSKVFDSRQK